MEIHYSIKQLGKKHPIIDKATLSIELLETKTTFRSLLTAIVQQQVRAYNLQKITPIVLNILSTKQLNQASQEGKISFGDTENTTIAQEEAAIKTALEAFEDGLFAVFLNDDPIESLEQIVELNQDSVFTFIRLTFLAGSIW